MTDALLLAVILAACALGVVGGLVHALRSRMDGVITAALGFFALMSVLMACGAAGAVIA